MFSAASPIGNRTPGVDVPSTFVELPIGEEETQEDQPRAPGCVGAITYRKVIAGLRLSVTEPIMKCVLSLRPSPTILKRASSRSPDGAHLSVEHAGESGAALATRHQTYNEDAELDLRFRRYTKVHYESWVEFAREKEYGENLRPVLVSGFDMTKDFSMIAYSNNNTSVQAGANLSTPMFGSISAAAEWTWHTACTPHMKHGPQQRRPPGLRLRRAREGRPSTEFNQCVFIRYYTMRSELGLFPRVIRAGAGTPDLGSGENRGDTFPGLTSESDAEPMGGDQSPGGRDPANDGANSELETVTRNVPYVGFFACSSVSVLKFASRTKDTTVGMPSRTMCLG